jgi:outer membrane protein
MKKIILTFAAVILSSTLAQAEFKLAYIDIQKAIQSSNAGKKAKEDLQKEADKKNKDLEKKKSDIEKMREDFEKKASVMSDDARKRKEIELQEEMMKWNQAAQKAQTELQKKEGELLTPIVDKMKKVVEKVAKEKGYSMVIQSNQNAQIVLFAQAELDITEMVIKSFNSEK